MELEYFTVLFHSPGSDMTMALQGYLDQIVMQDRLGHKEVWIGEHLMVQREIIPESDLAIAQTLSPAKKAVLGREIICMPHHNPFEIQHRIAALDHMAASRLNGISFEEGPRGTPRDIYSTVCHW